MNSITKMEKFLYCTLKIPTDEQCVIHVFESAISRKSTRPNQQRKRSKVAKYIKVTQICMARRRLSLNSKSQSSYVINALGNKRYTGIQIYINRKTLIKIVSETNQRYLHGINGIQSQLLLLLAYDTMFLVITFIHADTFLTTTKLP